tara:strand:- start:1144 stop:1536 length:393 start_codon:yes stop_codon:yes gene_type:complete
MASELRVNTLKDASGNNSIAMQYVANGSAKAWVHFRTFDNPPNPDDSFGVSGLTDNATEVEVNLTSAMSNLFFCPVAGGGGTSTNPTGNPSNRNLAVTVMTTGKVDSEVYTTDNAQSTTQCHVAVLGDLA